MAPAPAPRRIYLDNAATSFPKPPEVAAAMLRYMSECGASPGRGGYSEAIHAGRLINRCRELINKLIHGESPKHVIFAAHATDAINLAMKGVVAHFRRQQESGAARQIDRSSHPPPNPLPQGRGSHVHIVASVLDHNAVLRPLSALEHEGVAITRVAPATGTDRIDPARIAEAIRPETRLVVLTHASNVTGTLQPIEKVGAICRQRGVLFLADVAQTIGHVPIDVQAMKIDLCAFPGHKGLLGPLGTGGLYIRPGVERLVETLREGGTGTASERDVQPHTMPHKYEPGSLNAPGIIGLAEGVRWVLERGVEEIQAHEQRLTALLLEGLAGLRGLTILGGQTAEARTGVVAIVIDGLEPADLAAILEEHYGILVRAGLHCAPRTHEALGTIAGGGATRLSVGPFLTEDDIQRAVSAITDICREQPRRAGDADSTARPRQGLGGLRVP